MSGCGCSFTPVENKETEEIKYTDALAEQFAAEVGVDPRPNETLVEIDERGAFIRQPNAFIQPFGDKEGDLKAEANRFGIYRIKSSTDTLSPTIRMLTWITSLNLTWNASTIPFRYARI